MLVIGIYPMWLMTVINQSVTFALTKLIGG